MTRCYSGSAAELVYHLSCLYTLSSTLDKIEEKPASRSSKETVQTGEQLLIMMLRQVLTVRRLSMLLVSLRRMS